MSPENILWIYIILLIAGGLIGFFKAGSKISLIMSAAFAAVLILTTLNGVFTPSARYQLANIVMGALLVVFAVRLTRTKKFMPNGLMLVITIVALALRNIRF